MPDWVVFMFFFRYLAVESIQFRSDPVFKPPKLGSKSRVDHEGPSNGLIKRGKLGDPHETRSFIAGKTISNSPKKMNHSRKNSFQTSFTSIKTTVIQWYPQKLHKNIPSDIPIKLLWLQLTSFKSKPKTPNCRTSAGLHGIRHARGTQAHGEDQTGGQGRHEPGKSREPLGLIVVI